METILLCQQQMVVMYKNHEEYEKIRVNEEKCRSLTMEILEVPFGQMGERFQRKNKS